MWRISYLNLENDKIEQAGGFKDDKGAMKWMNTEEQKGNIIGLKLLVWSEYLDSYRCVETFMQS